MRRRHVFLAILACSGIILAGAPLPAPRAQTAATRYTFTRIASHGFPMVVEGSGVDPLAQWIHIFRPAISDDGVVVFGHSAQFPLNRNVVSTSDGSSAERIYGGGSELPSIDILGIDGRNWIYLVTSAPDPLCPQPRSNCIVHPDGSILASSTPSATLMDFLVNGAHPRLKPTGTPRVAYYSSTPAGTEYSTEDGLVAAPEGPFTSLLAGEYDVNASGEVVFMGQTTNGFGIFAGRSGESPRTVFLNYNNPGAIGFSAIHHPRIDDSGRVFFIASQVGAAQNDVYRIDPGSQEPVFVIDGNTGPLIVTTAVSVNGSGSIAFLATPGVAGTVGLYVGSDPDQDKVIAVGEQLGGRTVLDLRLGDRAVNNNGVAGLGQIVFAVRLEGDESYSLYRADPPGAVPENSLKPLPKAPETKTYQFTRKKTACKGGCVSYWDPPFAIGYEYRLAPGDPPFESVIPPSFPALNAFQLQLWSGAEWVSAGDVTGGAEHVFPSGGVDRFRLVGIPESLGLDVENPGVFVVGLRFVDTGGPDTVELSMTPLTPSTPPILSWPAPDPIVYGTALGGGQLNATSNVAGTSSYSPAVGSVLHAGTHALTVTFTPDDLQQPIATASVSLNVLPAPLTIAAEDKTMLIGNPVPALTVIYRGFVNGDRPEGLAGQLSVSTTATGTTDGDFPITASGVSSPDYMIEFEAGTLSVRPRSTTCLGEADRRALWPINPNGTSVFKKGGSVIVRFRACTATGVSIGTAGLVTSFRLVRTENGTAVQQVNELPLLLPPSTSFQWDPFLREWLFVLSTRSLPAQQTYSYRIDLRDGTAIDFRFGLR